MSSFSDTVDWLITPKDDIKIDVAEIFTSHDSIIYQTIYNCYQRVLRFANSTIVLLFDINDDINVSSMDVYGLLNICVFF